MHCGNDAALRNGGVREAAMGVQNLLHKVYSTCRWAVAIWVDPSINAAAETALVDGKGLFVESPAENFPQQDSHRIILL